MHLDAARITIYSYGQLAVLLIMQRDYLLAGFSTPSFLVFTFVWLLSDLASWVSMCELGSSIRTLKKKIPRSKLD